MTEDNILPIGELIKSYNNEYRITARVTHDKRPNANVYLCEDTKGDKFIAKHFYAQAPMSNIALGKNNHYGRRRDGSDWVFNEIHDKNKTYDFLLKHIVRIRHNKKWIIILEYVPGIPLSEFISSTYQNDIQKVDDAIIRFTNVLTTWHNNKFAHGDPHLDNVMIDPKTMRVVLIDYGQLHHPDFYYCKQYDCFDSDPSKRLRHDLNNYTEKLGAGFRTCLGYKQDELNLGTRLTDLFDQYYTISLNH